MPKKKSAKRPAPEQASPPDATRARPNRPLFEELMEECGCESAIIFPDHEPAYFVQDPSKLRSALQASLSADGSLFAEFFDGLKQCFRSQAMLFNGLTVPITITPPCLPSADHSSPSNNCSLFQLLLSVPSLHAPLTEYLHSRLSPAPLPPLQPMPNLIVAPASEGEFRIPAKAFFEMLRRAAVTGDPAAGGGIGDGPTGAPAFVCPFSTVDPTDPYMAAFADMQGGSVAYHAMPNQSQREAAMFATVEAKLLDIQNMAQQNMRQQQRTIVQLSQMLAQSMQRAAAAVAAAEAARPAA